MEWGGACREYYYLAEREEPVDRSHMTPTGSKASRFPPLCSNVSSSSSEAGHVADQSTGVSLHPRTTLRCGRGQAVDVGVRVFISMLLSSQIRRTSRRRVETGRRRNGAVALQLEHNGKPFSFYSPRCTSFHVRCSAREASTSNGP